ncbi:MAG: large conductance mechanosensitive channel protein MscL [Firmicutes bacterium]|nr:large conductance mechanosensitive channel protein MscL [Bacillota bacterium]
MWKEFKSFAFKGNVLDLAIGVIIGGAFGKIVTSLVNDIIMPLFGVILGGLDFTSLQIKVGEAAINYGLFIQSVVDFLIISACIFLFIKMLSQLKRKEEEKPAPPPAPSPEIALLTEIRDLLKERS